MRHALFIVALACAGCPSSDPCPNNEPNSCPAVHPTWDGGILSIFVADCMPCHRGLYSPYLDTYDRVVAVAGACNDQVFACLMPPPPDGGPSFSLTPQERSDLLQWFECGTP